MKVVEIAGNLRTHDGIEITGLDTRQSKGARFGNAHLAIAVDGCEFNTTIDRKGIH